MARRSDEAYVLRTQALGEADLIVTLLAEHAGRLRGVAASAKRSRRRFGGALDPMTRVRAAWSEREGRELHRIESLEPARSFSSMQSEPATQAACAVLAEIAGALASEEEPDPKGFRLLGAVLDALEGGLDPWVAVRYFEYWTLRLHGLLPDVSSCGACGAELRGAAGIPVEARGFALCAACERAAGGRRGTLSREDLEFLRAAAARGPSEMATHREASRPGGALEALLRGAIEAFTERSFRAYRHLERATRAADRDPS